MWKICITIDPITWWRANGTSCGKLTPLATIALNLAEYPSSIACVERGNKEYGNQKTKVRNRMSSDVGNKVSVVGYALKVARSASAPAGNKKHLILLESFQPADTDMVY